MFLNFLPFFHKYSNTKTNLSAFLKLLSDNLVKTMKEIHTLPEAVKTSYSLFFPKTGSYQQFYQRIHKNGIYY